MVAVLKIRV